ncbi:MAG: TonB-dependent receptor [Gammaproteobacteria bacterium]|jgi:iron complex outermembrane recepter protein|nr:TonB-dependent receptor [Gammaproteobacteria bacterium]MBT5204275.1 TonB-dependent receptor [Gammaproteobacteria bacterium]MBT5600703.1 TonB-dependent receptor [Gammaproteobacteria bacterium]MBT6244727.1 TonB-dependent receptor [Gammaproteobacteria bacterium]
MTKVLTNKPQFIVKPLAIAVALAAVGGQSALAEEQYSIEEIIVSATRRNESVQDVPMSIDVLGEAELENNGVGDLEDFAHLIASLNYVTLGPGTGNVYMRGISSGGESLLGATPNVAVYMDEQPVTAVGSFLNPHIYDVSRIETLAGPQGTLYGANAQAGSIRFITNKPIPGVFSAGYDLEVNSVSEGDTGNLIEGFVNIPIGDRAAIRIVGYRKDEAGYIDNVPGTHTFDLSGIRNGWQTGGDPGLMALSADKTIDNADYVQEDFNTAETTGGRVALRVDLNENWTVTASVMRQELEAKGVWDHDPTDVGDLEVVRFQPDTNDDEWTQSALVVEGKIGDMSLTYAYSDLERESYQNADYSLYSDPSNGSPGYVVSYYACYVARFGVCADPTLLFTGDQEWARENHEIRLVSDQEQRVRWIVGAFYEEASHDFDLDWHVLGLVETDVDLTGLDVPAWVEGPDIYWTTDQLRSNKEIAYFGEISVDFTESLTASYSVRYFDYESSLLGFSGTFWWPSRYGPRGDTEFNNDLKIDESDSVNKFNLSYSINDDLMVYGTYSEGYRPGGLNRLSVTAIAGAYQADILTSHEIGMKGTFVDGRLRLNAAYYTQEWDDFQLSKIDTSVSVLTLTDNVGNAESDGLEIEGSFLITENWDINFGLSAIDSVLNESYWVNPAAEAAGLAPNAPAGNELPRVPDLKWNLATRYNFELMGMPAFIQGSYTSVGESYNLLYDIDPVSRTRKKQDGYQVGHVALGVEQDRWSAELFVKNITDERGEVFINGATYDQRITTVRPRTIGLRFRHKFD